MLEIAKTASLSILRKVPMGVMLGWPDDEVLLPAREVPEGLSPGDRVEVFVTLDSEERPIATTAKPLAEADEFASLRVASVNPTGAFLDWGLPKDLLLPFRNQLHPVDPEEIVVVRVMLDRISGRPVATTLIERFLEPTPEWLGEGQSVQLMIYEETELGSKAIIDERFGGLLYRAPEGQNPKTGDCVTGYIQRIRTDGKVDLSLAPSGRAAIDTAREIILQALTKAGGRLDLGDRSEPELIRQKLGLSKKAFKRGIGALYRERLIKIAENSIESVD